MPTRPLQTIITTANTVSRASVGTGLVAEHDGRDQRDLDDGDRQRQQQRAVGLADPLGDHLGMMHGREHRAEQDHQQHRREQQSAGRRREAVARVAVTRANSSTASAGKIQADRGIGPCALMRSISSRLRDRLCAKPSQPSAVCSIDEMSRGFDRAEIVADCRDRLRESGRTASAHAPAQTAARQTRSESPDRARHA